MLARLCELFWERIEFRKKKDSLLGISDGDDDEGRKLIVAAASTERVDEVVWNV